jgi:hypothetical protein
MYRYKDDVYDRIWSPYTNISFPYYLLEGDWRRLNTSLNNVSLSSENPYNPPAIVMSTAVTPINVSAPLNFIWRANNVTDKYFFEIYLYDFEAREANETREFNIKVNDILFVGPRVLNREVRLFVGGLISLPLHGDTLYEISLSKTENSTLPPILNAIELYKVIDFSQLETQQDDGN